MKKKTSLIYPMRIFTFYSDDLSTHKKYIIRVSFSIFPIFINIWSGVMQLFFFSLPQLKTWELGWHGRIFLRWTAPVFGVPLNGQWFSPRPTRMFGKHHLLYALYFLSIYRDNLTLRVLSLQEGSPPLSWERRCLIAEGTARGLEYLHSNHHVHRDVKRC